MWSSRWLVLAVSIAGSSCSLLFDARDVARDYEQRSRDGGEPIGMGDPTIISFEINPPSIARGDTALLRWKTSGGATLELVEQDGPELLVTGDSAAAAEGFLLVEPTAPATYELTLRSGDRPAATRSVHVLVLTPSIEAPALVRFDAEPTVFVLAPPRDAALEWETSHATAVELSTENRFPEPVALSGQTALSIMTTTELTLTASNPRGSISAVDTVWFSTGELEPNDRPNQAITIDRLAIFGRLEANTDQDWFRVSLPTDGMSLAIEVKALDASCHPDALLSLFRGPDVELAVIGDEAAAPCPTIDPRIHTFARDLPAGDYYFNIHRPGPSPIVQPNYLLLARVIAPAAGNGILDRFEECDDGDRVIDDGCDEQGKFEPGHEYAVEAGAASSPAPAGAQIIKFSDYPGRPAETGLGYAVIPLEAPLIFFGRTYAALIVHSTGVITFSPAAIEQDLNAQARIALFAGELAGLQGALLWTYESEGEPWTAIEFQGLTARSGPARGVLSLSGRVAIARSGRIELGYLRRAGDTFDLPLAAGIQDARGKIGRPVPGCSETCSVSRLPEVGEVIRFRPVE